MAGKLVKLWVGYTEGQIGAGMCGEGEIAKPVYFGGDGDFTFGVIGTESLGSISVIPRVKKDLKKISVRGATYTHDNSSDHVNV